MMGIRLAEPFPLYPDGFPPEIVGPFEEAIGRRILGNAPASGTEIVAELGEEHLRTGQPIVYTSGDSVFQIATHKDVVALPTLYEWSRVARRLLTGPHTVGRVIARPFEGPSGAFVRSPERRDFAVPPPGPTVLDRLQAADVPVYGVGKIRDIFSGQGITEGRYSDSNDHGIELTLDYLQRPSPAFVFTNLVDFDSKYGHRNDPAGYAKAIEAFDRRLPDLMGALDGGVLFITGDHGCDPTSVSTDHTRERTPLLAAGLPDGPHEIGTRGSFGDLGQTIAALLGVEVEGLEGESFTDRIGLGR
jgi:phosphopentomutase